MESELPLGGSNSTGHLSSVGFSTGGTGRMHHSLSTPAGVDCGGGSSLFRTPPATPKKGGKMLAVRVQMLDDSITMFQVQAKALGRVLFDQVCRQLHLLEADYFGLEYQELGGTKYWLDLEKPVCRQLGLSLVDPLLRFCVKFYTPDPAQLEEEFTRYLFCLQIKRDLAHGCIQCNENTLALMASYIVQAECGDFVPEDYPDHTYLSSYKFFPLQDANLERRIMENHKKHIGQSPAEADLNLLETARRCELYGMKMHPAKDHEGVPLNIAVAHMGIVVFQHLTKINTFSWAKIRKISFKRKRFLVKLHPEGYGYYQDLVEFFFEGRNECKNFWKKCVENHGFFRCSTIKRIPRHRTRVLSRGSSFRYSGRTQKQMVEFVRDNYVKRQTFQRSQSFRVSRSLRSSRANVSSGSANLINSSISAHPLLPLPPGSNAISLEWDKQPQYLEASLMMKGYTGEAAREALVRRKSEGMTGPHRQLGIPMSSAATREQAIGLVTHAEVNHHRTGDASPPRQMTTPLGSPESTWSQSTSLHSNSVPEAVQVHRLASNWGGAQQDVIEKADAIESEDSEKKNPSFVASTPNGNSKMDCDDLPNDANSNNIVNTQNFDKVDGVNGIDKVVGRDKLHSDSSYSIDVLSGGESEYESLRRKRAGQEDSLGRLLKSPIISNGVISNEYINVSSGTLDQRQNRRYLNDRAFCVAKELLMTERTFKKDLEVITLWLREELPLDMEKQLCGEPLWEPLEKLSNCQTGLLRALEVRLGARTPQSENNNGVDVNESKDPHFIGQIMLDYLQETLPIYQLWLRDHLDSLKRLENACNQNPTLERLCREFEAHQKSCYLPLYTFALKPLYRLLQYKQILQNSLDMYVSLDYEYSIIKDCLSQMQSLCQSVEETLPESLNFYYLCLLHRDMEGMDSLVSSSRRFVKQGCLFKYTSKGPQQRMFFLFSDILVYSNKGSSSQQQFKVHGIIPLHSIQLELAEYTNSFSIYGGGRAMTLSANSPTERDAWISEIENAASTTPSQLTDAALLTKNLITSNSTEELTDGMESGNTGYQRSNTLAHVCWHRNTSLSWQHLEIAMENQLSGYLLRKFKNSHGWQRLWVVFASFCLYFYKASHDDFPLASLPLLGYIVTTPSERDGINKDFVLKLVFKNHIYFFRAENEYTFKRWIEVIGSATTQSALEK